MNKVQQVAHHAQDIVQKDVAPISLGGVMVVIPSMADITTLFQQLGVILGTVLVTVTLAHRIWKWRKEYIEDKARGNKKNRKS